MVIFTFSIFNQKYFFSGKFGPKNQKPKCDTYEYAQFNGDVEFLTGNTVFEQICFQKSKLSV